MRDLKVELEYSKNYFRQILRHFREETQRDWVTKLSRRNMVKIGPPYCSPAVSAPSPFIRVMYSWSVGVMHSGVSNKNFSDSEPRVGAQTLACSFSFAIISAHVQ